MLVQGSYVLAPPEKLPLAEGIERLDCLATALNEINEGVIFLNSDPQIVWYNRAFDKLTVENKEGLVLVAAVIDLAKDFRQDLRLSHDIDKDNGSHSASRSVVAGAISHRLHCTLMPKGMFGAEPYLLCLVKRSASRWSSYEQHLRQTWSLTEREAQVAVECLQGKKNLEIAECLKISVETVNKHLDKVYQKVSVRGRSELASRLLDSGII